MPPAELPDSSDLDYYNETRTHLSLDKDALISRAIQAVGRIVGCPVLSGLHHQYVPDLICDRDRVCATPDTSVPQCRQ